MHLFPKPAMAVPEGTNLAQYILIAGLMIAIVLLYTRLRAVEDLRYARSTRFSFSMPNLREGLTKVKGLFRGKNILLGLTFLCSAVSLGLGIHWFLTWNGGDMTLKRLTLVGGEGAELLLLDARDASGVDAAARALLSGSVNGYVVGEGGSGAAFALSATRQFAVVPDDFNTQYAAVVETKNGSKVVDNLLLGD